MISLFFVSACALKLSDPSSLRVEENVSLKVWCVGVGCVMPFTPASCLSWCDWNVDKQSDAEARGAFQNSRWGDAQTKYTAFSITFSTIAEDRNTCEKKNKYFFAGVGDKVTKFPGGDAETKEKETELKCGTCYHLKATAAGDTQDLPINRWVKFFTGTASSKMVIYTAEKCADKDKWKSFELAVRTGNTKVKGATDETYKTCVKLSSIEKVLSKEHPWGIEMAGVVQPRTCPLVWVTYTGSNGNPLDKGGLYCPNANDVIYTEKTHPQCRQACEDRGTCVSYEWMSPSGKCNLSDTCRVTCDGIDGCVQATEKNQPGNNVITLGIRS